MRTDFIVALRAALDAVEARALAAGGDAWTPQDWSADIAAKRKLIELHAKSHPCPAFDQCPGGPLYVDPAPTWRTEPCFTLQVLAETYGIRASE